MRLVQVERGRAAADAPAGRAVAPVPRAAAATGAEGARARRPAEPRRPAAADELAALADRVAPGRAPAGRPCRGCSTCRAQRAAAAHAAASAPKRPVGRSAAAAAHAAGAEGRQGAMSRTAPRAGAAGTPPGTSRNAAVGKPLSAGEHGPPKRKSGAGPSDERSAIRRPYRCLYHEPSPFGAARGVSRRDRSVDLRRTDRFSIESATSFANSRRVRRRTSPRNVALRTMWPKGQLVRVPNAARSVDPKYSVRKSVEHRLTSSGRS